MTEVCTTIREEIAELLLLRRGLPAPLARHVAVCAACSAEAEGVRRVIRTFERADAPFAVPAARSTAHHERRRRGRTRARITALVAGAVVAACAAVTMVVSGTSGPPSSSPVAVAAVRVAQDGVMVAHPWGTEIPVSLSGLLVGHTYRLMTGNASGERVPAGSVRAATSDGQPLRLRLASAMHKDAITALYVQDAEGRFLARADAGIHRTA